MDFAIGELGLKVDEFYSMTLGNYVRTCYGAILKNNNELRKLRTILGAISGKNPKLIMPLPGDWDHVELCTPEWTEQVMHKLNVFKKWTKNGKDKRPVC